jgi:hypothetical protein
MAVGRSISEKSTDTFSSMMRASSDAVTSASTNVGARSGPVWRAAAAQIGIRPLRSSRLSGRCGREGRWNA